MKVSFPSPPCRIFNTPLPVIMSFPAPPITFSIEDKTSLSVEFTDAVPAAKSTTTLFEVRYA